MERNEKNYPDEYRIARHLSSGGLPINGDNFHAQMILLAETAPNRLAAAIGALPEHLREQGRVFLRLARAGNAAKEERRRSVVLEKGLGELHALSGDDVAVTDSPWQYADILATVKGELEVDPERIADIAPADWDDLYRIMSLLPHYHARIVELNQLRKRGQSPDAKCGLAVAACMRDFLADFSVVLSR